MNIFNTLNKILMISYSSKSIKFNNNLMKKYFDEYSYREGFLHSI